MLWHWGKDSLQSIRQSIWVRLGNFGQTKIDRYLPVFYNDTCQLRFFINQVKLKETKMTNTSQTFKVAGITTHNGNTKVRFTDDLIRRIKQFTKGGATRCDFVELPSEMTKIEALKYLLTHPDFQSNGDQATISDTLADREKEAGKGTVKVKASKPSLDAIKARGKKQVTAEQIIEAVDLHNVDPA
jgi:hypothetical protein